MSGEKPKYGFPGSFQRGYGNLFDFLNRWRKFGWILVFDDRFVLRKGMLTGIFPPKEMEEIRFKDIISYGMKYEDKIGPVGIAPWLEIEYISQGKTKKLEFAATPFAAVETLNKELERKVGKK
jgi:hypothetical protein